MSKQVLTNMERLAVAPPATTRDGACYHCGVRTDFMEEVKEHFTNCAWAQANLDVQDRITETLQEVLPL